MVTKQTKRTFKQLSAENEELHIRLQEAEETLATIRRDARDVTEQKQAEEASRNYAMIVESSDDAIFSKSLDGTILTWNRGAEKLYGYSAEEVIGKPISILIPTDSAHDELNILAQIASGEHLDQYETVRQTKDGRMITVSLTVSPIEGAAGRIVRASTISRDITERKHVEAVLHEQANFPAFNPGPNLSLDQKACVTVANPAASRLGLGIGTSLVPIIPHLELVDLKKLIENGKTSIYEARLKDRDFQLVVLGVPEINQAFVYGSDISERKLAESAVSKLQILLNEAQEIARIGAWEYDVGAQRVFWTDEVYRIHGVSKEYDPGNPLQDTKFYAQDDQKKIDQAFSRAVSEGVSYDLVLQLINANGEKLWVRTMGRVEQSEGKIVRVFGNIMDITERKLAEEEIKNLNNELEKKVIRRTIQLEATNKELEAFTYSVSHDLRAPLRAITGFTNILAEDYESSLDEEGKRICAVISDEAQRMGKLIDDLLTFSRLSRIEKRDSTIDMQAMMQSVFNELTSPVSRDRIVLVSEDLPYAVGDPGLFRQVWVNLLSNAIKFTSKKVQAVIEVGSTQGKDEIIYFVRDNGAGFDMRYVSKLFGVFQRLHSGREFEGTGVGLAIVQRVILRHGGRVWAEGQVDQGAKFYFALPRLEKQNE